MPQYHEVITDTITSRVSVSGQQHGPEENNLARVLIPDQVADQLQQIQPPVCLGQQKQENSELAMRQSQHPTPTRKAVTHRDHEVQTGTLVLGALGVLLAQVLHGRQIGEISMSDACYAPYAVERKRLSVGSSGKLICDGGMRPPQPCDARSSSVVSAKQS